MSKIIAAINLTLDGMCDHTVISPDEAIHDHYTALIDQADGILYGRITYELMKYWKPFITEPSGEPAMDNFARAIDRIPKIVFSNTMQDTDWDSARLALRSLEETVKDLKQQSGGEVLVGSRSLIASLTNLNLIDEYQLCIHPVITGKGLPLFDQIARRTVLKLITTKVFSSGAILSTYEPTD